MAKKKISYSYPNVGENWLFTNGEIREVVAIHNGFLIDWVLVRSLGGSNAKSGKCDLRSWYEGKINALRVVEKAA